MGPALCVQKGSRSSGYVTNLERSIESPVDVDDVQEILEFLERKGKEDSETYQYIRSNQTNLFVWGSKTHSYAESGFEDVKESKGEYMCFIAGRQVRYIGKISQINDITEEEVKKGLSERFWDDDEYTNIWFLSDVGEVERFTRNDINSRLGEDIFNTVFGGNMQDNLRRIDENHVDADKLNILLDDLKSNSEEIEVEQSAPQIKRDDEIDVNLLKNKKQVILYGPPGTGKTYKSKDFAVKLLLEEV